MRLLVNGSPLDAPDGASVALLIDQLKLAGRRLAVECNGEIVVRSSYAETRLHEGDTLEIVQAIGGG
ncbi:MAG TPA: sulfur carrier protein ThiS [Nevskiaceae bacterium]|nr:sulfur carrier protein ThiS [Nevskiaceae bacterium]